MRWKIKETSLLSNISRNKDFRSRARRALSYLKRGGSINNQIYPIVKIIRDGRFTFFATTVNRLVESFKVWLTVPHPLSLSLTVRTSELASKFYDPRTQRSFMSTVVKHPGTLIPLISFVIAPLIQHPLRPSFSLFFFSFSTRATLVPEASQSAQLSHNVILGPAIHRFCGR